MYPIKIIVRNTPKSSFLDEYINKKAYKLNHFNQRITSCRIVVDMPQKHKHQGKLFRASISLNIRGKELVVNRKLDEDVYIAVTDAFDAIERKLEDYSHRRVNGVRRRKRVVNDNGVMEEVDHHVSDGKASANDDLYMDDDGDLDSEDDVYQIMRDENLL